MWKIKQNSHLAPPWIQMNSFWNYCEVALVKAVPLLPHRQKFLICSANLIVYWWRGCGISPHLPALMPLNCLINMIWCHLFRQETLIKIPGWCPSPSIPMSTLWTAKELLSKAPSTSLRQNRKPDVHIYSLSLSATIKHVSVLVLRPRGLRSCFTKTSCYLEVFPVGYSQKYTDSTPTLTGMSMTLDTVIDWSPEDSWLVSYWAWPGDEVLNVLCKTLFCVSAVVSHYKALSNSKGAAEQRHLPSLFRWHNWSPMA